jgi:tetratricopeptide (TPR) repeat protein
MIRHLLTIILCFIITISYTQNKSIDSVLVRFQKEVSVAETDTIKIEALLKLGNYQIERDFKQAEKHLREALALANKTTQQVKKEQLANLYGQLGVVYKRKGDYPLALNHYLKSETLFHQLQDSSNIANICHNIAMLHRDQRNYPKAIALFKKTIQIKEAIKDEVGTGIAYNMMGVIYRKTKRLDSALICYQKAKNIFIQKNSESNIYRTNSNLAALYHYQKKYNASIDLHLDNLVYYTKINRRSSLFSTNHNMAKTYLMLRDYDGALKHTNLALKIAMEDGLKDKVSRAYLRRSYINGEAKKYKQAYEDYKLYKRYSDSIYNKENVKKIQALELNYKFNQEKLTDSLEFAREKRELDIIAQSETSKKQLYLILFLITLIGGVIITYLIRRLYKNREQIALKELEENKKELNTFTKRLLEKRKEHEILSIELKQLKTEVGEQSIDKLQDLIASKILTKQDWLDFKQKFNAVHPTFFLDISKDDYKFTTSEERLIALEKLGLKSNEIANMLGISFDSVVMNRYRLRKKLNAPKDISILEFLEKNS